MPKETSKRVLMYVLIWCGVSASVVIYGWFKGNEDAVGMLSIILSLALSVVGFYTWKAKAENILKIAKNPRISEDKLKQIFNTIRDNPDVTLSNEEDIGG